MAKDTRLQKMLAECGIASRRKAEEMIAAGRVAVNGVRAQIGDKVDVGCWKEPEPSCTYR